MLQARFEIDVGPTAPFEGSQGGNIFVDLHPTKPELTHDKRTVAKQQSKSNLYREACRVKNCLFVPIIMHTTGIIHEQSLRFPKKMARNASEHHRDIPFETLLKYYIEV